MGSRSGKLLDLQPVVFRYKSEAKRGPRPLQFGLIAEDVAERFPHLAIYDDSGEPLSLRYDLLTPLLLNELQMQHRQNQIQWAVILGMLIVGAALVAKSPVGATPLRRRRR